MDSFLSYRNWRFCTTCSSTFCWFDYFWLFYHEKILLQSF